VIAPPLPLTLTNFLRAHPQAARGLPLGTYAFVNDGSWQPTADTHMQWVRYLVAEPATETPIHSHPASIAGILLCGIGLQHLGAAPRYIQEGARKTAAADGAPYEESELEEFLVGLRTGVVTLGICALTQHVQDQQRRQQQGSVAQRCRGGASMTAQRCSGGASRAASRSGAGAATA
jgi:hypothetical protein